MKRGEMLPQEFPLPLIRINYSNNKRLENPPQQKITKFKQAFNIFIAFSFGAAQTKTLVQSGFPPT
ncbi:hypothetical protein SAMN02745132_03769 [Enterovibrio nigricans DSM 22720]|uniref:Uncharacterized protein n=1 Tax=Enterovibrio nigricans DSM 22720 TaxID=1121868 RepID=A0A1T4VF68_9GAMM|nr:hypothetical protein SAMN02745132_03769 [Enterovibrio nigricans DSM 22720]